MSKNLRLEHYEKMSNDELCGELTVEFMKIMRENDWEIDRIYDLFAINSIVQLNVLSKKKLMSMMEFIENNFKMNGEYAPF